jgi:hypothetical protein
MLTSEQKAAVEKAGTQLTTMLLMRNPMGGPTSPVGGFQCTEHPARQDVEDWLARRLNENEKQQAKILNWAIIAGVAGIVSAILTAVTLWK